MWFSEVRDLDALERGVELLARSFAVDVLACASGEGRMRLLARLKGPASTARHLAAPGCDRGSRRQGLAARDDAG